jgi:hypothetical protein
MIHRGAHHWGVDHRGTGASGHGTPGQPIGDTANQSTPSGTQPIRFHPAHYRILSGTQPSQSGRKTSSGTQPIGIHRGHSIHRDPSGDRSSGTQPIGLHRPSGMHPSGHSGTNPAEPFGIDPSGTQPIADRGIGIGIHWGHSQEDAGKHEKRKKL